MCVYVGGWSGESLKYKQKLVGLRSQGSQRLVRDGCGLCVCVCVCESPLEKLWRRSHMIQLV